MNEVRCGGMLHVVNNAQYRSSRSMNPLTESKRGTSDLIFSQLHHESTAKLLCGPLLEIL